MAYLTLVGMLLVAAARSAPPTPGPPGTLADRVVADVEGDLVLHSDLSFHEALEPFDVLATPFWSSLWSDAEQRLVDAAAIRHVAGEVALYDPSPAEVGQRLEAVTAAVGGPDNLTALLQRLSIDRARLQRVITRRLTVDRYLLRNLRTDPDDALAWSLEAKDHLRRLRERLRIRRVPVAPG